MAFLLSTVCFAQGDQHHPNPNKDLEKASKELLNPTNHILLMIDHESQMVFAVESQPIEELRNNTGLLSVSATLYNVPTIITTLAEKSFSGAIFPEIKGYFSDEKSYIDQTTMNSWEDVRVVAAVNKTQKKKLVIAGLWTEVYPQSAA